MGMCNQLAPHIARCALMSGDGAISWGTWLHPKNNNWDLVLRESLSLVLGEGKVFPLDITKYVAKKSKCTGTELNVTELLEGITTKKYEDCVLFNQVQDPPKGKRKDIWEQTKIAGEERQAKMREARLALEAEKRLTTQDDDDSSSSSKGAGLFDSPDSDSDSERRRRLIGRLEASKRCAVAA